MAEIETIVAPNPHFVAGADRHKEKAIELLCGVGLLAEAFSDVRANRFARPAHLIAEASLLDFRPVKTVSMDFQGQAVGPLPWLIPDT